MPPMRMIHPENPRDVVYKKVGMTKDLKIPGFELFGNRVLCGLYERPEKTAGGIILTQKTRSEEVPQGKAALILMKGVSAFKDDDAFSFHGNNVEIGDWIMLFVSYGLSCNVNGYPCRIIRDQDITMRIPSPDQVY